MKYKLKIIISILVVLILVIVFFYFKPQGASPVPAEDNNKEEVVPEDTSLKSIYDGTYTGKFNYEYQDWDDLNNRAVGPWTSSSFELTLTLKTVRKSYSTDPDPYVHLDAFNVVSSDSNFGTGVGGVNPKTNFGGEESVSLPVDPAKQDGKYNSFVLIFPSGASIEMRDGGVKSGSDGKTIFSNPDWVNPTKNPDYRSWSAKTPSGTLWVTAPAVSSQTGFFRRHFRFGNWSLTKTSS